MKDIYVPYIDLSIPNQALFDKIMPEIKDVLATGQFILGNKVEKFEKSFAKMHGVKYAVGVSNGTDALILSLKSLGISEKDEVITCPNSYLASASSIVLAGAKAVFCDVDDEMNMDPDSLEKCITKNTKAIIPVHLTGKPARMTEIKAIAKKYKLRIIEDAAQAVGARLDGISVGSFGDLGCFSLHPLKNLSACGDAGIITTNNKKMYEYLISARNHGMISRDECEFFSINSRLDALQAAILNVKLKYISSWNDRRREIAALYNESFKNYVNVPEIKKNEFAVFHTYIIQTPFRNELQLFLKKHNIATKVHYPIPIHKQKAWLNYSEESISYPKTEKQSKEILSLPIFPELTSDQVNFVIQKVSEFFNN